MAKHGHSHITFNSHSKEMVVPIRKVYTKHQCNGLGMEEVELLR